jgi:hypothetical protein
MNTASTSQKSSQAASALLMTLLMTGIGLATLAGAMTWAVSTAKLTYRSNQYTRSVAAAEAATEKAVSRISQDFLRGGERLVTDNLNLYRQTVLTASDSPYWSGWEFNDASSHAGQTFVEPGIGTNYIVLSSSYAGLRGHASTYTVVANARETPSLQNVVGAVLQEIQLVRIPIFQFVMFSSGDMEISCGQPFTISGRVHCNRQLYIEPDNIMTFESSVTAVGDILFQRGPLDTRTSPVGSVTYQVPKSPHEPALTLPIGTTNTPTAIREIIQPPPAFEDPDSPIGRQRYYNLADMLVVVSNASVSASSGSFNGFMTPVPASELGTLVTTTNSFWDAREEKVVRPIDINVGALTSWSATNSSLRPALGWKDLSSIYVLDRRTPTAAALGAVRVVNGRQLPSRGLTVATASPLYVLGHYNQTNTANLGTPNTSTTLPASLVGDALTVLSGNWSDANSTNAVSFRTAAPTTVNAALLAGAVETTQGKYGGGMENFPRFLETWGLANTFTYNGSLVKMFPSLYATNAWGKANVYAPPKRNWAFDINFNDPAKLPPLTPGLQKVIRSYWATVAPNQTALPATH